MSLPNKGRILALDLGTNRTGVSISDPSQQVAFPREEINHKNEKELVQQLIIMIEEDEIVGILTGLPLGMRAQETEQTRYTRRLISNLNTTLNLPILTMDERLTTKQAILQKHHNLAVDSDAAQIMLETYLAK